MASEQLVRPNATEELKELERDVVPKMTTRYECLTEKAREDQQEFPHHGQRIHHFETRKEAESDGIGSQMNMLQGDEKTSKPAGRQGASLEEISNMRAMAQQSSMEAIRAAEEHAKDGTMSAAGYVGEKAVAAKDMVAESGKGAAGYVGKMAGDLKDQAVAMGWGTAHYTLEKVEAATKAAAGVTSSAAGYTSRKEAEARKDMEANNISHEKGEQVFGNKEQYATKEQQVMETPLIQKMHGGGRGGGGGGGNQGHMQQQQQGNNILHSVRETIIDIGHTTKDFLVGHKDEESNGIEDPYPGGAKI